MPGRRAPALYDQLTVRAVSVALGTVLLAIVAGIAFGVYAGLDPGSTGGARDRPLIFWMIAPCLLLVSLIFWPLLLSWFVELELPNWVRTWIVRTTRPTGLEALRQGKTILALARSLEPNQRFGLARSVLWNGLGLVFLSVPMPIFFGVAATVGNGLEVEEAVPLALSMWIPILWTAILLGRRPRTT